MKSQPKQKALKTPEVNHHYLCEFTPEQWKGLHEIRAWQRSHLKTKTTIAFLVRQGVSLLLIREKKLREAAEKGRLHAKLRTK